ncbi:MULTISPECIES: hypothetical protein [unclassified Rathayibacter]|uniref:hypothetical protein n=1 Tax=unclassified Rathayibacter TaxID=2609250 RepID=UPI0011B0AB96|nr:MULTISPECIES: hypothetical protein [unclassified Rathayibacter]
MDQKAMLRTRAEALDELDQQLRSEAEATEFAGQECETRNPSPSGHSSDFVPYVIEYEDSMPERANQNTRTLMFGVLLGLAGGFAASLVAWGDSRRRDRREETQKQ